MLTIYQALSTLHVLAHLALTATLVTAYTVTIPILQVGKLRMRKIRGNLPKVTHLEVEQPYSNHH